MGTLRSPYSTKKVENRAKQKTRRETLEARKQKNTEFRDDDSLFKNFSDSDFYFLIDPCSDENREVKKALFLVEIVGILETGDVLCYL